MNHDISSPIFEPPTIGTEVHVLASSRNSIFLWYLLRYLSISTLYMCSSCLTVSVVAGASEEACNLAGLNCRDTTDLGNMGEQTDISRVGRKLI